MEGQQLSIDATSVSCHLFQDHRETRDYYCAEALITWPSVWGAHVPDMLHVEVYEAPRGKAFFVRSHFDIRSLDAGQWNRGRSFTSLDDAAREAADLWTEGMRLTEAYWRGEPLQHPGATAVAAWNATAECAAGQRAIDEAVAARSNVNADMDSPSWHALSRAASAAVQDARDAHRLAGEAWCRAQGWREHRDVGALAYMAPERPAPTGQLSLLECV